MGHPILTHPAEALGSVPERGTQEWERMVRAQNIVSAVSAAVVAAVEEESAVARAGSVPELAANLS